MSKAGIPNIDCDPQAFMLYKIQEDIGGEGGRGGEESFLEYKKSNPANYQELPIRLTDSHRGHTQWLFFISELYFNPSSFFFFHFQSVQDPNVFANLFLMGFLASRKPCQIIIIQLLSGTPVVASTCWVFPHPAPLTLAGEIFFSLGKHQIRNLAVWPHPARSSKGVAALPGWWSFYIITSSLASPIYTLADKKAFVKLFLSNKLKSVSYRKTINPLFFLTQMEERLFLNKTFSHFYLRTSRWLLTTHGSALSKAIAFQKCWTTCVLLNLRALPFSSKDAAWPAVSSYFDIFCRKAYTIADWLST